jgi:hypothetical protein
MSTRNNTAIMIVFIADASRTRRRSIPHAPPVRYWISSSASEPRETPVQKFRATR